MQRVTKTDCYTEIIVLAAREHDNELLLQTVTELATRAAEHAGKEALRMLERVEPKTDAWGHIDRKDQQTRRRLLLTAGIILELLRRAEANRQYDRPPTKHTCCA